MTPQALDTVPAGVRTGVDFTGYRVLEEFTWEPKKISQGIDKPEITTKLDVNTRN